VRFSNSDLKFRETYSQSVGIQPVGIWFVERGRLRLAYEKQC